MSKRIIKNIVMVLLIIVFCIAMYFSVRPQSRIFVGERNFEEMMKNGEIGRRPNDEVSNGDSIHKIPENMSKEGMNRQFGGRNSRNP